MYEIPQPLLSLDNLDNSTIQYFTTHIELRSFSRQSNKHAVTRIRTWVIAATTQCTNHYTITAMRKSVDFIGVYTRNVSCNQIRTGTLGRIPLADICRVL